MGGENMPECEYCGDEASKVCSDEGACKNCCECE